MATLGFIGLGVMGGQMVSRLLDKGYTVLGYNRTRTKAQWLIDRGMHWAESPRAVAEGSDITLAMVTNSAAVEAIQEADLILMGPGSLYTSVIPNLLIPEIADSIARSRAPRVYVANLMT